MAFYEGPKGDFFLTDFRVMANGQAVKFADASQSYAKNGMGATPASAKLAIDEDMQTAWSCSDRPGEAHEAVFNLAQPLAATSEVRVKMQFGRHYSCSLGRFRISATAAGGAVAAETPADIRALLALPDAALEAAQRRLRS
jgi:hypothetical protein